MTRRGETSTSASVGPPLDSRLHSAFLVTERPSGGEQRKERGESGRPGRVYEKKVGDTTFRINSDPVLESKSAVSFDVSAEVHV